MLNHGGFTPGGRFHQQLKLEEKKTWKELILNAEGQKDK